MCACVYVWIICKYMNSCTTSIWANCFYAYSCTVCFEAFYLIFCLVACLLFSTCLLRFVPCYRCNNEYSKLNWVEMLSNWPISQIPQRTCPISHNAPLRTEMCTFLFWMVHCGIYDRCIVRFANLIHCTCSNIDTVSRQNPRWYGNCMVSALWTIPVWLRESLITCAI